MTIATIVSEHMESCAKIILTWDFDAFSKGKRVDQLKLSWTQVGQKTTRDSALCAKNLVMQRPV